jgi:hypothetical protein
MGKRKTGPTFFDVLRTTKSPRKSVRSAALDSGEVEEKVPPVANEPVVPPPRLAVDSPQIKAAAPVPAAPVPPLFRPRVSESPVSAALDGSEPEEKSFRVTVPVALFAVLIALIAVVGSFAVGVRYGMQVAPVQTAAKTQLPPAPAAIPEQPKQAPAPAVAQPESTRFWTIKLYAWSFSGEREKAAAQKTAQEHRDALAAAGFTPLVVEQGSTFVLVHGKYKDRSEARNVLDALRKFKYNAALRFKDADFVAAE